jgi:LytS/YehU family sensor histidine kinase
MFVPLEEELEVVRNYIELEKLRFKEKFQYRIDINPTVDTSVPFPRMLLQMQVENAIKHGLQNSEENGLLEIFIRNAGKHMTLIVQDNGIGRVRAQSISNGTGSGQSLTNSIVELYNKISRYPIAVTVEDVGMRNGESYGTRVIIKLPIANE